MALISYYSQPEYSHEIDVDQSPYTKAHTFKIEVTTSSEDTQNLNKYLGTKSSFTGIIDEIPELSYSTTWGDSPAAVVNEKIKKFTQNKWIKMFAMQDGDYRPPLLTDAWTQQFPKAAEPLSVSIKFRAYPIDGFYNTTQFNDIIRILLFVTTPQSFSLDQTMEYMNNAGRQATSKGEKLATVIDNLKKDLDNGDINFKDIAMNLGKNGTPPSDKASMDFMSHMRDLGLLIQSVGDMSGDNVGGCPLINLTIANFIQPYGSVKWILKSWSFKPSLQVTYDNLPIYVDFNISLQTQYILSNTDFMGILGITE